MERRMKVYSPRVADGVEWALPQESEVYEILNSLGPEPVVDSWAAPVFRLITEDEGTTLSPADCPWLGRHVIVVRGQLSSWFAQIGGGNVEILPLVCPTAELSLVHVLDFRRALDVESSDVVRFTSSGRIMRIREMVLDPSALVGAGFFKLAEYPRGALFVTGAAAEELLQRAPTGFELPLVWSDE
jgi:hypothetical protein